MSLTTTAFKRTFLTATRTAPITTTRTATAPISRLQTTYQPISRIPNRHFSATMGQHEGVHNLTSKKEFDEALKGDGLMVLDCFATWCGPCKVISPQVVKFSGQYTDARFYKLDVDEVPDVAQELSVRAMPTFMFFKNGEKLTEVVGANPTAVESAIKNNL